MCLKIMCSNTFAHAQSRDIGLYDVGRDRFPVFGIGMIFAYFHLEVPRMTVISQIIRSNILNTTQRTGKETR